MLLFILFHVFLRCCFNSQKTVKVRGIALYIECIRKMTRKCKHGNTILKEAGCCWGEVLSEIEYGEVPEVLRVSFHVL